MSRSYKKNPIVKDHDSGRYGKKQANKKVRRNDEEPLNGATYKRVYNSWDIHDYISRWTKEEAEKDWDREEEEHAFYHKYGQTKGYLHKKFKTKERFLNYWRKCALGK